MRSEASLARAVSFPRVLNIDDLRRLARRRLPAVVFAYIDGGAEDEVTLRENVEAFRAIAFRPRQCVAVPKCDLRTTVLGTELSVPFMLAPVGFCRMFYPRGEFVAAREAPEIVDVEDARERDGASQARFGSHGSVYPGSTGRVVDVATRASSPARMRAQSAARSTRRGDGQRSECQREARPR